MINFISNIRYYFERNGFYVSSRVADRLGMRVKSVRLFFIYVSFATFGIGFAIYLTLAFWLKLKDLILNAGKDHVFENKKMGDNNFKKANPKWFDDSCKE